MSGGVIRVRVCRFFGTALISLSLSPDHWFKTSSSLLTFYTAHVPTRPIFWAQVVYFFYKNQFIFYKRLFLFLKIAIVVIFHIIYLLVICFPTVFRCEIYQQSLIFRTGTWLKTVLDKRNNFTCQLKTTKFLFTCVFFLLF